MRWAILAVLLLGIVAVLASSRGPARREVEARSQEEQLLSDSLNVSRAAPARATGTDAGSGLKSSAPQAAAESGPAAPAHPPQEMTRERFEALITHTLRKLPTLTELEGLDDEEVHDTPEALLRAATLLGNVAQALHGRQDLEAQGVDFYSRCTLDGEMLTPVRAMCYSHLLGNPKAPDPARLPADVVRLAQAKASF